MRVKYKLYRLRVKMRKGKKKNFNYLDDIQKKAYGITIQMINDKNSNIFYDPYNDRNGIQNKDVFVEICNNKIKISNGVSHDDIPIDDKIRESLMTKLNAKMTRKFNAIEAQFINRAKNRLDGIKKEIKKK